MEEKIFDVEENKTDEQTEAKASIKDTVEKAADKSKGFIKKMWSEKRVLSIVVLVAFIVLLIAVSTAIAVSVRPEGEYYRYTYDAVNGEFINDNAKIEINNSNRFVIYDTTGNIVTVGGIGCVGEYTPQEDGLNIRVENLGTVIYTKYYIKNGNYIIDPVAVIPQISDSIYTDKDKLEGYYNLNINGSASTKYLFKKKVYSSVNGTTDPASFTKEEGEYDQSGDFLTITNLSGISTVYLILDFTNVNNKPNKGLATVFYSKKTVRSKTPDVSGAELESRTFAKSSNNSYEIKVMSYPDNKEWKYDSISIVTDTTTSGDAAVSGNSVTCTGTGNITIDIKIDDYTVTRTIRIVDFTLLGAIPNLTEGLTYNYTTFTADFPTATSISATGVDNDTAIVGSHGNITFNGKGTATVTVSATWSDVKLDGTIKYVTITRTATVTVV